MTRDVAICCLYLRNRHLSERYVLGEINVFVDFYLIHYLMFFLKL